MIVRAAVELTVDEDADAGLFTFMVDVDDDGLGTGEKVGAVGAV